MAKQFVSVFKPGETPAEARPLPSRIRIKGANHEHTEKIKDAKSYADLLYRARLTVSLHNRDNPDDPWEIQEEREKIVEVPA